MGTFFRNLKLVLLVSLAYMFGAFSGGCSKPQLPELPQLPVEDRISVDIGTFTIDFSVNPPVLAGPQQIELPANKKLLLKGQWEFINLKEKHLPPYSLQVTDSNNVVLQGQTGKFKRLENNQRLEFELTIDKVPAYAQRFELTLYLNPQVKCLGTVRMKQ